MDKKIAAILISVAIFVVCLFVFNMCNGNMLDGVARCDKGGVFMVNMEEDARVLSKDELYAAYLQCKVGE